MTLNIADQYYLKAKGAMAGYCSDWEEACEAIGYAISYDEYHCPSLCLLGEIQAEYLQNFEAAFESFDKCIASDVNYTEVYPNYIKYLLWANELSRAKQVLAFAKTIKGVSLARLFWCEAYLFEIEKKYKKALKCLANAKKVTYANDFIYFLQDEEHRIQKKLEKQQEKKKAKQAKKASKNIKFRSLLY